MKKLLPLLIIGILVFSGFGTSAYTNDKESNNLQIERDFQSDGILNGDELDQYQLEMEDYYVYIGVEPDFPNDYYIVLQEFIPTKRILTRVELLVCKDAYTTYDLTVSIRDIPDGTELTSISKNYASIPTGEFTWIEFDFEDIEVIPGNQYYIVCKTDYEPNNRYNWGITIYDLYPNGTIIWLAEGEWYFDTEVDTTFKTYGFNNLPPSAPTVSGPTSGKPGESLTFTFNSVDPEGHDVRFLIDWGDGDSETTSFTGSGNDITASHAWSEKGTYILNVKAEDEYGATSIVTSGIITIPRSKVVTNNMLLLRILERFPLIQKLLPNLGL